MVTLGIACWGQHEAAAALVRGGRVLAAAEEERFSRRKFDPSFPAGAIRACLLAAGCEAAEVEHVGFYWRPWLHLGRKAAHLLRNADMLPQLLRGKGGRHLALLRAPGTLRQELPELARARFHFLPHHDCHAASAFFTSPFERATVLTVDGAGEWRSSWWGLGEGERLTCRGGVFWPHSLGHLYAAVTEHLGFRRFSDEYKVMGLAAYGDPSRFRAAMRRLLRLKAGGGYALDLRSFQFHRGDGRMASPRFADVFGPPRASEEPIAERHRDLAAALQERLEDALLHLVRHAVAATGEPRVCLAGGVALNGVAIGRLLRDGVAERVFVPPAASDAGTALGAALLLAGRPREPLASAALGPEFTAGDVDPFMESRGAKRVADPSDWAAGALAAGKVVGWFQGRLEFGARALGNRSILADPRVADMKDRINRLVKFREGFRPFAPAVLDDRRAEWFDIDHPSPFMNVVLPFRSARAHEVPAVVHADGTGRLQTVTAESNPRFHRLIERFGEQTGVPMVLNTSFNVQGEPIVCTPEQAVACYERARLDALVVHDWVLGACRP